jgi:hypothetical protein
LADILIGLVALGFAEIARYLNSRPSHQPRRGERWTRQTVVAVASRAGLIVRGR